MKATRRSNTSSMNMSPVKQEAFIQGKTDGIDIKQLPVLNDIKPLI